MAKKKGKSGRPEVADKVEISHVYLRGSEKRKILKKHKDLTKALRDVVLPECA